METSIKKDIRNILEILQNPTSISRGKSFELFDKTPVEQSSPQQQHQLSKDDQVQDKHLMAMLPSESEFSFELCMDTKRTPSQQQQQQPSHSHRMPSQVHRSISQPECTNTSTDKNLLRYTIYAYECLAKRKIGQSHFRDFGHVRIFGHFRDGPTNRPADRFLRSVREEIKSSRLVEIRTKNYIHERIVFIACGFIQIKCVRM